MTKHEFTHPADAIQARAAIEIAAPPEKVAAIYREVEKWHETFPATIEQARIVKTGENWQQIDVKHKLEGHVPNTLIFLTESEIALEESKKRFDATFLNQFHPVARQSTHYVITAYISLKGFYKLLKPLLQGYVRRQALKQMNHYVLEPLKRTAEKPQGNQNP